MATSLDVLWMYMVRNDLALLKETLSRNDINVNDTDRNGATILHRFASGFEQSQLDKTDVVELLVNAGIDLNATENLYAEKRTALHISVLKGSLDLCKILVNYRASIDAQDKYGNTPLGRAIMKYSSSNEQQRQERGKIIEMLLLNGSNPTQKNNFGSSPLDLAQRLKGTDVIKFFCNVLP